MVDRVNELFKPIIKSGVVPHIVSIVINEDDTDILEEACWCILHLCTGKNKLVLYLIEHEILNALKSMISMYNKDIARNAIRSVANWCIQSNYIRDFIMEADFHEFIIEILPKFEEAQMINDLLMVLCNMFRKKPLLKDKYLKSIVPVLIKYIKWFEESTEIETIMNTLEVEEDLDDEEIEFKISLLNSNRDVCIGILWALSFLPERQICKICMNDEQLLKIIIKIYQESRYPYLRFPALRFLGNICSDDDILARKLMIDFNIIETMKQSIKDHKIFMRRETCWVISNIVCGPISNSFIILKNGLLDEVLDMYLYDEPQIMLEASWIILNITQKLNDK